MLRQAIEELQNITQQRQDTTKDQVGYVTTAVQALIDRTVAMHADSMREAQEKHEALIEDLNAVRTALVQNLEAATNHGTSAMFAVIDGDM
jgi:TolA-binding protein